MIGLVHLHVDQLAVVPVELEEPADDPIELGPRAHLPIGTALGRGRLDGEPGGTKPRRRKHGRKPLRKFRLADPPGLRGIDPIEPRVGERAHLVATDALILVSIAVRQAQRRKRRHHAAHGAAPGRRARRGAVAAAPGAGAF